MANRLYINAEEKVSKQQEVLRLATSTFKNIKEYHNKQTQTKQLNSTPIDLHADKVF